MSTTVIASLLGLFLMASAGAGSATPSSSLVLSKPNSDVRSGEPYRAFTFSSVVSISYPSPKEQEEPKPKAAERRTIYITAYSSSEDETDSTPFITASGTEVRDGIVATNALPMGTNVRIPELFGDKIFVVEDRMHHRFKDRLDIWMPSKAEALRFGKKLAEVEILE